MVDLRTVLAAVLGVAIGALLLLAPGAVVRAHRTGRVPGGESEYGTDAPAPQRWRRLVQLAGVACVGAGLYFAWTLV